ncbi:MAG: slipin family protein [Candidatus Kariarchaeaceae archaeon]|jgi:regulator of protease activity HflC (stomatin/prohibitin superfamily)
MVSFIQWVIIIAVIFVVLTILSGIRLIKEYERVVIFRLGRFNAIKGPGIFWVMPYFDKSVLVDLRTRVIDIPRQEAITKDNIPLIVNAAVFYSVNDPAKAVIRVESYAYAVSQISQTTLRSVIGAVDMDELITHRDKINEKLLTLLDEASDAWGVDVTKVELKDVEVPDNMKRAMARQAESERERRSRIILAEGELQASEKLAEAARLISDGGGLTLRLLQTIQEISTENSSTIIIPFPADLTGSIQRAMGGSTEPQIRILAKDKPAK